MIELPQGGGVKWGFGWPAFWWVVRAVCVAGACVVLVVLCGCFLITQQRVFQSVFSVLACCGLAWFFFEWTFLSCLVFLDGVGVVLLLFLSGRVLRGSGPVVFTESLILAQDERWRRA